MSMIEGVLAGMSMRTRQQQDDEDRAYLKKKREQEDEDRTFAMSERQRAIQMRTDMGRAAARVEPVEVKQDRPDTMDDRDVGQPGEAPLPTAGYDVDGKRFTDLTSARAAAAEANTPQAVTARMSDVLMRNGDPIGAQKLRIGAMEEQTSQFKLNDAMRADIDAKFNADIRARVTDWDSLDKFVSDSASDGHGGAIKLKTVPSADGKTRVVNVVLPDGSLKPTEKVFPNTADGLATAAAELERMPAEKKLAHLHQKAMLARQLAADESSAKYHEGMLGVAQQNANTQEKFRRDQAGAMQAKAAGAAAAGGMTMADLKDGHKSIASTLNADWKTQIEGAADEASAKRIKIAREAEIADVQRLYTGAMTNGMPLTPEQAIAAYRTGKRGVRDVPDSSGKTHKIEGIMTSDGTFLPFAGTPGASMPQPAKTEPSKVDPKPAPAPAPTAEPKSRDPLAGLGRQQIREARAKYVKEIERWRGDPNAAKLVAEAQALIDRIDNGQY